MRRCVAEFVPNVWMINGWLSVNFRFQHINKPVGRNGTKMHLPSPLTMSDVTILEKSLPVQSHDSPGHKSVFVVYISELSWST